MATASRTSLVSQHSFSSSSGSGGGGSSGATHAGSGGQLSGGGGGSGSTVSLGASSSSGGSGGILANAHEATPRSRADKGSGFAAALKTAFIPPQPGKQLPKGKKPLGKSFERQTPLSPGDTHAGGDVLPYDPRGQAASAGDGILPPASAAARTRAASGASTASSIDGLPPSSDGSGAWSSDGAMLSPASERADDDEAWHRRGSSATTASSAGGESSGSGSQCAIRFAPLPSSGRLKRANSITIGVAARSHLLSSQGAARQNAAGWQQAQLHPPSFGHGAGQVDPSQKHNTQMWYNGGPKPDDVVDVGEELRKGALKAWRKVRGARSESPAGKDKSKGTATAAPAATTESPVPAAGDATPRRAGSPDHLTRTSKDEAHPPEGGQPQTYHLADGDDHAADGARTPRNGMTRRLSTGAFLGNASLRGMQDDRRKKVLGLDGDDEDEDEEEARGKRENARFAESLGRTNAEHLVNKTGPEHWHPGLRHAHAEADARKTHTVAPDSDASEDLSVDSERDDDDDADDEETREAERLAAAAADRPTTKAGGLEKFEKHTD